MHPIRFISQHASKFEFEDTFDRRFDHFYRRNWGRGRKRGSFNPACYSNATKWNEKKEY